MGVERRGKDGILTLCREKAGRVEEIDMKALVVRRPHPPLITKPKQTPAFKPSNTPNVTEFLLTHLTSKRLYLSTLLTIDPEHHAEFSLEAKYLFLETRFRAQQQVPERRSDLWENEFSEGKAEVDREENETTLVCDVGCRAKNFSSTLEPLIEDLTDTQRRFRF